MGITRTFQIFQLYNRYEHHQQDVKVGMHNSVPGEPAGRRPPQAFQLLRKAERQAEATALEMLNLFGMADLGSMMHRRGNLPLRARRGCWRSWPPGPLLLLFERAGRRA